MYAKQASWTFRSMMQCKKVEPSVASSMQAAQARLVEPSRASNMFALSASWTFRSIRHVCNGKERDYHPTPPQHTTAAQHTTSPSIQPENCFEARGSNGSSISDGAATGWFRMWGQLWSTGVLFMFCFPVLHGWIYCVQHITCNIYIYSWRNLMYLTSNRV